MRDLGEQTLRVDEADQAEPVRADRDRQLIEHEIVGLAQGRRRRRRAGDIRAVRGLEEAVLSRIADQAEPVGADRNRREHIAIAGEGGDRGRRAGDVRAMGDLQLMEPRVADQGEPVGTDSDRAVRAREVAVELCALVAGPIEADAGGARRPL